MLRANGFKSLAGQRVGLITNHTGLAADGTPTAMLFHNDKNVNLSALFSPEHGFAGKLDIANVGDATDTTTGLKVFSLYGKTRTPTPEMLSNVDTLVFDIQDIGTRFYTYISTMKNAMQAADNQRKRFVVLDRPNPIGGSVVAGPVLDKGSESFVAAHRLPVQHGMTVGEIAKMIKADLGLKLHLEVVAVKHWTRATLFDETGLTWVNPSPNMRCLTQALTYPGIGLLETTNLSVGRGTDTPFEVIGASWIDGRNLAKELNASQLPGVRFVPIRFTPTSSKYANEVCGGVNIVVTNRDAFEAVRTGVQIARTLRTIYPKEWDTKSLNRLLGHKATRDAILNGTRADEIVASWQVDLNQFLRRRSEFQLYD